MIGGVGNTLLERFDWLIAHMVNPHGSHLEPFIAGYRLALKEADDQLNVLKTELKEARESRDVKHDIAVLAIRGEQYTCGRCGSDNAAECSCWRRKEF